jgi:hypothetical protein
MHEISIFDLSSNCRPTTRMVRCWPSDNTSVHLCTFYVLKLVGMHSDYPCLLYANTISAATFVNSQLEVLRPAGLDRDRPRHQTLAQPQVQDIAQHDRDYLAWTPIDIFTNKVCFDQWFVKVRDQDSLVVAGPQAHSIRSRTLVDCQEYTDSLGNAGPASGLFNDK